MALHETLAAKREEVIARWKLQVRGEFAPETLPTLELVDHIPQFLDEIVEALKLDAGASEVAEPQVVASTSIVPGAAPKTTAAGHGAQRLRLGFSLDAVVGEYGSLRDSIVAIARDTGAPIAFRELQIIFDCVVTGIAHAVSEYTRQRDAELLRLANEHFAFIAHELRNPLSSASTALQLLKLKGLLPVGERAVGALERGLLRTRELVDETLRVARMASGIEIHRRPTSLRTLFDDAVLEATPEAEAKGVQIALSIENDAPIALDARLVASALGNLLRNGVKYTAQGSKVQLRGKIVEQRAVIEVEDCCGGLPPGKIEAAFAPFVRLDKGQDGFGLGLAIAKQAVEAHGGNIRVQNVPGKGCIFVLELPVLLPMS